ncbi:MAG: BON domain-containing protein [bacterium]
MENIVLASRVKAALASNTATQNCNVDVVADKGIVTISGKVESMDDVENIEELVKHIEGVKGVSCKCHPHYLKDVVL